MASHNSHLLNPAYRIWRDSLTTQSSKRTRLAAQFAYSDRPRRRVRPADPLSRHWGRSSGRAPPTISGSSWTAWRCGSRPFDLPGQLNRYPYTLSLARDIWGLADQALDPEGVLSEEELRQDTL